MNIQYLCALIILLQQKMGKEKVQQNLPIKIVRDFTAGRLLFEKTNKQMVNNKKEIGIKFLFILTI